MKRKEKSGVLSGVLILSAAGILVKILGVFYKIPLTTLLGDDGMGFFSGAYTIYLFFYLLATAGLPIALSMMVAKARVSGGTEAVRSIDRVASRLFWTLGIVFSALLFFCAPLFARMIGNPGAAMPIAAIAPSLLFAAVMGEVRGYFQGFQFMLPTALSQITEAVGKVILGVFLANLALRRGYPAENVAAFAILGITISSGFSMLMLLIMKAKYTRRRVIRRGQRLRDFSSLRGILSELVRIALPITLSSSVISLSGVLDLVTVMHRLQSVGYSAEIANAIYGNYTALAGSMVNMPIVLIVPISTGLVPYITASLAEGRRDRVRTTVETALRSTLLIAMPAAFGMSALAKPILCLLFEDGAAQSAAPLLAILAPSLIFTALANVTGSILQSVGGVSIPVLSMTAGGCVKLVLSWFLIGKIGIYGTPIGTFFCYFVICLINFGFLTARTGVRIRFSSTFLKPLIAALVCGAVAGMGYPLFCRWMPDAFATLCAIFVGGLAYLLVLLLIGGVEDDDLAVLPGGKRLLRKIGRKSEIQKDE